jgi:hypothetical protein
MGEVIRQLQNGKWETYGQLGGLLLRSREYIDELYRDPKLAHGFVRPNGLDRDLMNASAALSRTSRFVLSIEGNHAPMAIYCAEFMKLHTDLADIAITNRFARGVAPQIEARMEGDAAAAERRPAAFDLVAAELAWVFTSDGRKAVAYRLRADCVGDHALCAGR